MTIKYVFPDTLAGIAVGVIVGTAAAALIGPMIVRLRGIYFAMATIAFGQVFYFIAFRWNSMTGGDDGLSGWRRLPIDLGFTKIDILNNDRAFYYLVLVCFAIAVGVMAALLRSPFGRTLLAIRENERRTRFFGVLVDRHIWLSWMVHACLLVSPERSMRCSTISRTRTIYAGINPAISSSWPCLVACAPFGGR